MNRLRSRVKIKKLIPTEIGGDLRKLRGITGGSGRSEWLKTLDPTTGCGLELKN
jgi:hypothetical protein